MTDKSVLLATSSAMDLTVMNPGLNTMLDFFSDKAASDIRRTIATHLTGIESTDDPSRVYARTDQALTDHPLIGLFDKSWRNRACYLVEEYVAKTWAPMAQYLASTSDPLPNDDNDEETSAMTQPVTVTETMQDAATPANGVTRERLEAEVRARQAALQQLADAHVDEFNAFFVAALAEEQPQQ